MSIFLLVAVVEDLYKSREPVLEMRAIYFMTPTAKVCLFIHPLTCAFLALITTTVFSLRQQCVEAFIKDFKPNPKYNAAYVYFTDCK